MPKTVSKSKVVLKTEPEVKPREELVRLHAENEKNLFNICLHLANIYENQLYKDWGFNDFKSYVATDLASFNIEYRVALYRVNIGKMIKEYNLEENIVNELSYSKMKELFTLVKLDDTTSETIEHFINEAKNKTFREVQAMVKREKLTDPYAPTITKVTLTFTSDQRSVFDKVVEVGKSVLNTENISLIIDYVLIDWLSNNNELEKANVNIKDDKDLFERISELRKTIKE